MTKEDAKSEVDFLDYYLQNHANDYSEESHTAMRMAYKALEQENNLDKIRAKIEQIADEEQEYDEQWARGLRYATTIIDKYQTEMEK
jgi:hypothetical protein